MDLSIQKLVISRKEKKNNTAMYALLTENNPSVVLLGYPVPAVLPARPPAYPMNSHVLSKSFQTKEICAPVVAAAPGLVSILCASQLIGQRV